MKEKCEVKNDCFAIRKVRDDKGTVINKKCEALNDLYCAKQDKCSFYISRKDYLDKINNLL